MVLLVQHTSKNPKDFKTVLIHSVALLVTVLFENNYFAGDESSKKFLWVILSPCGREWQLIYLNLLSFFCLRYTK
jgi:hypothetical protein